MSIFDGIMQGIIQGITEFLPISSDGHITLYQHLTGNAGEGALFFTIMLHLGTLLAVFAVYHKTIYKLIVEFFVMIGDIFTGRFTFKTNRPLRKFIYMLILATLPLLLFVLVKDFITGLAQDDDIVVEGLCFIFTAAILFLGAKCVKGDKKVMGMKPKNAFIIGMFQGLAILPGVSRSGSTISSGLLMGFKKEFIVEFSFILGIPAILGASVLEVNDALAQGLAIEWLPIILGVAAAAVVGFFCIHLIRYLVMNEKFVFFAYYTFALGVVTLICGVLEHIYGANIVALVTNLIK